MYSTVNQVSPVRNRRRRKIRMREDAPAVNIDLQTEWHFPSLEELEEVQKNQNAEDKKKEHLLRHPMPSLAANRIKNLRGKSVILEDDLSMGLGISVARLEEVVERRPDWFTGSARFRLRSQECDQLDLWWTRSRPDSQEAPLADSGEEQDLIKHESNYLSFEMDYSPRLPIAYSVDGLIAMAHWLAYDAQLNVDAKEVPETFLNDFRKIYLSLLD
jgi:hypothetical protein